MSWNIFWHNIFIEKLTEVSCNWKECWNSNCGDFTIFWLHCGMVFDRRIECSDINLSFPLAVPWGHSSTTGTKFYPILTPFPRSQVDNCGHFIWCLLKSLTSEATPSTTQFFKRSYKISNNLDYKCPWMLCLALQPGQKSGMILPFEVKSF